jgi:hypothetical protein
MILRSVNSAYWLIFLTTISQQRYLCSIVSDWKNCERRIWNAVERADCSQFFNITVQFGRRDRRKPRKSLVKIVYFQIKDIKPGNYGIKYRHARHCNAAFGTGILFQHKLKRYTSQTGKQMYFLARILHTWVVSHTAHDCTALRWTGAIDSSQRSCCLGKQSGKVVIVYRDRLHLTTDNISGGAA